MLRGAGLSEEPGPIHQCHHPADHPADGAQPSDGNKDGKVDNQDVANYNYFSQLNEGRSSCYDFNYDGLTNQSDLDVVISHRGTNCR